MAVDKTRPAGAPADDAPAEPVPSDEHGPDEHRAEHGTGANPDLDEMKRKFRAALDRKRGTHASADGAQDTGKVHGSHGPAASRRSFRRKSGS
jgi:Family of unknown function (DUF5302)